MTQAPTLSSTGMFTRFQYTQVVRTVELDYNQMLRVFDALQPQAIFNQKAVVIVDKVNQQNGNRVTQVNILKAVMVSSQLYTAAKVLNPTVVPFITETTTSDDFFIPDDRFSRLVPSISPSQTMETKKTALDGSGNVIVGVPFVDVTLQTKEGLVPTSTSGAAGTASFGAGHANASVTLSFVTQAIHPTLLVTRQETQIIEPALDIDNNTLAVFMNSTLAGLLGITLPSY